VAVNVRGRALHRNTPFHSLTSSAFLVAVLSFALPGALRAQRVPVPTRLNENTSPAMNGQITVLVQQDTGSPFTGPATITLRSYDMSVDLKNATNAAGQTVFNNLPVGQYLVEITSPGYNTVREQVAISSVANVQNIPVVMIPDSALALARAPAAASVAPKAIKETEKGLHALQIGKLDETQSHLDRALAIAPNFADGNYLMGVLLLRRNDSSKALSYLQKAVSLSPDHAPGLLALGEAAYLQGDFPRSTESLERSIRVQPRGPQAATAQELISRMRESAKSPADPATGGEKSPTADLTPKKVSVTTLKQLATIAPVTETNWLPADVDQQKLVLDPGATCQLDDVIKATGDRVKELVENVDRFTATEKSSISS
jgi:hypothetical protein